jgi:hypothetical protein
MPTYITQALTRILAVGPYPGEEYFRIKVTGNGETHWMNICPSELQAIIRALDTED